MVDTVDTIPCPLCASDARRTVWTADSYPAIGGQVVPVEKASSVPWLPVEISMCLACGHVYQSRPPEPEVLEGFYSEFYISSNPSPAVGGPVPRGLSSLLKTIRDAAGERRGTAMEIGAYDGYFLHLLEQDGWSVVGYEPAGIAELGKEVYGIDIRREFYRPGVAGEAWDLVVSRLVFEHLTNPGEVLAGLFEEISPGGWLVLEVPDMEVRWSEGILGCFAHEHISYFTPATLKSLIGQAGFRIESLQSSAQGLAVVAQRPRTTEPRDTAGQGSAVGLTESLLAQFNQRRSEQRRRFEHELARWSGPQRFVIYGADSHTTDLLVEGWLPVERVRMIIDDDPMKQGHLAAGFEIPVRARRDLPETDEALVILSAFAHHDRLWDNLDDWRRRGGAVLRFYSECRLVESHENPQVAAVP